jgi:hypothetical protein
MEMQERLAAQGYLLGDISIDPKISLGFGNQIRFLSEENGFWTYQILLPSKNTEAFLASASLTHATTLLKLFNMERILESESFQLLAFATSTDVDLYGAPIVGEIGIPLRGFLDRMYREENTDGKDFIEQAMIKAWRKMHGKVTFSEKIRLSFKLREHGFFHLDCPGNACGLDPYSYPKSLEEGYEFCPHNTDAPKQQLTLLAGLAAICTLAKKG